MSLTTFKFIFQPYWIYSEQKAQPVFETAEIRRCEHSTSTGFENTKDVFDEECCVNNVFDNFSGKQNVKSVFAVGKRTKTNVEYPR